MSGSIIVVMLVRTEREIVADLRKAGATSPERAIRLAEGKSMRRGRIRALANAGVLRGGSEGHYLDEDAWRDYEAARRKRSFIIIAVSVTALVLGYILLRASA